MKIQTLIQNLQQLQRIHGDIDVAVHKCGELVEVDAEFCSPARLNDGTGKQKPLAPVVILTLKPTRDLCSA